MQPVRLPDHQRGPVVRLPAELTGPVEVPQVVEPLVGQSGGHRLDPIGERLWPQQVTLSLGERGGEATQSANRQVIVRLQTAPSKRGV